MHRTDMTEEPGRTNQEKREMTGWPSRPCPAVRRALGFRRSTGLLVAGIALLLLRALIAQESFALQPRNAQGVANNRRAAGTVGRQQGAFRSEQQQEQDEEVEEVKYPKLDEMKVPSADELLHGERRDWIVFKTDEVLVCEPVYPRPNTLEKMQAAIDAYPSYGGPRDPESLKRYRERFDRLHHLEIRVPDDPQPYRLNMRYVAQIIHHEDLMLRRASMLMDEGKLDEAYELIFVVARRYPKWPGLEDRRQRLLFLEAGEDFSEGRAEKAIVTLESLFDANPNYPGLRKRLGEVTDALIAESVEQHDFRRARHFLLRLYRKDPRHAVVTGWIEKLVERATTAVDRAQQYYEQRQFAEAARKADEAAFIWPNHADLPAVANLTAVYHRVHSRFPRLKVGVVNLAGEPTPYFLPTPADRRHRELTQTDLFEISYSDDAPHFRSRLLEQWEPTDLGRRAIFTLRQTRADWEPEPLISASSVLSAIRTRLDASSPSYDERLAGYIDSVTMLSPFRFQVRFSQVPLRTEALFTFPAIGPAPAQPVSTKGVSERSDAGTEDTGGEKAAGGGNRPVWASSRLEGVVSKRFVVHERTPKQIVYRRARPQPDRAERFFVEEIIERKYPSYDKAVQGLLRGEVSMLPHVPSGVIPRLAADERFTIVQRALPVTHLILFNPNSAVLRHRELRRALAYAIDRERILRETVLGDPASQRGRLISGPFPTRGLSNLRREVPGYAYSLNVKPRPYDLTLAVSLALAAQTQLDAKLPELKLVCEPDPIVRAAARRLIDAWSQAGIKVTLLDDTAPLDLYSSDWHMLYRTVTMTDPVNQLWPLLTLEQSARVESLDFLPDWLRLELIELDKAGNWETAVALLHRLHEHLAAETQLIPLWEVDDYFVVRKNIGGYPDPPLYVYHDVERWTVTPWFEKQTP